MEKSGTFNSYFYKIFVFKYSHEVHVYINIWNELHFFFFLEILSSWSLQHDSPITSINIFTFENDVNPPATINCKSISLILTLLMPVTYFIVKTSIVK